MEVLPLFWVEKGKQPRMDSLSETSSDLALPEGKAKGLASLKENSRENPLEIWSWLVGCTFEII